MIEHYVAIKHTHITAVLVSVSVFALRGILMLAGSRFTHHAALRYASYVIDTVLLASAVLLTVILSQYPLSHGWLTAKVLALLAYIVLGSYALKRGRTYAQRASFLIAALATFGYMYSVARAHHPAGFLLFLI
ncbi:MAG TPA: SirB2 family protein [Xanthomonadaceae bacterium]|nr:SirB2 family protein [Xanthomonadaceae bacterium]